jgi:hypothetical protein
MQLQLLDPVLGVFAHFLRAGIIAALRAELALIAAENNVPVVIAQICSSVAVG